MDAFDFLGEQIVTTPAGRVAVSLALAGLILATGHYRNGVLLAPLTASLVADLVLDGRECAELASMRPDRFGL